MRNKFFIAVATLVLTLFGSEPASAQTREPRGDPRILMVLSDSLVMCEGDARFARIEVAWKSDKPAPSDDPPDVRFSSAGDSILTVKPNSHVTAHKAGSDYIVAHVNWGGASARREFLVTVLPGRRDEGKSKQTGQTVCGR